MQPSGEPVPPPASATKPTRPPGRQNARPLRRLSLSNTADSPLELLQSPIRHADGGVLPPSRPMPPSAPTPVVAVHSVREAAYTDARCVCPARSHSPSSLMSGRGPLAPSPFRRAGLALASTMSKAASISDLLARGIAALDRQESVDALSGLVRTEVPSLADLMDYDIEPGDLRSDSTASLQPADMDAVRQMRGERPSRRKVVRQAAPSPGPVAPTPTFLASPPTVGFGSPGRRQDHRRVTDATREEVSPITTVEGGEEGAARPVSPVPWGASDRKSGMDDTPVSAGVTEGGVELLGRGVLVQHSSRPLSLYGNLALVSDVPPSAALTFTQSRSTLGARDTHTPDAGSVHARLWDALYGDGSQPSTSVVITSEEEEEWPYAGLPTSPVGPSYTK